MPRFLITGGTGFVGSALARELQIQGNEVVFATRARNQGIASQQWIEYDLNDRSTISNIISARPDGIFHLAWSSTPSIAENDPSTDVRVNLGGTVALFAELSNHLQVPVIVASSGGTVYGVPEKLPIPENHALRPISVYGLAKATAERYAENFVRQRNLDLRVARISNPFGARQSVAKLQGAASIFARKITRGESITIWGDGSIIRDYIHVDDVGRALIAIMSMARPSLNTGMPVFNVGSGEGVSLRQLIDMIGASAKVTPDVRYLEGRPFDVQKNVLDIQRIKHSTGWAPLRKLPDAIRALVNELAA